MKRILISTALMLSLALLVATPAFAASQNVVVYGSVYDVSGTPMQGVTITLENRSLGISRTTTSDDDGSYNFAEVPPAEGYRITAIKSTTKIDIRAGITVNVGDERVILPPLKEQPVTASGKPEPKEIKGGGQKVTNEIVSSAVSGVITGDQLHSLPLYNRNFLSLGGLTPNAHDVEAGSALSGASFSVAGQRPSSNDFLLDGSDNVASSTNQAVPFQVNEAIQEFRVTSSNASAEYGRNQGAVVNIVTRRGGNAFHGGVFGYFGWDGFNAKNPLSSYNGGTFDKAAQYAGAPNSSYAGAFPLSYNDWVSAGANIAGAAHCSDSINVTTGSACSTGGVGSLTRFDPSAGLAANSHNEKLNPFESEQFGINAGGAFKKDKWVYYGSYEGTLIDNPNQVMERVPSNFDRTYNPLFAGGVPNSSAFNFANADPSYQFAQNLFFLYPKANVVAVPGVLEFFQGQAPNYTDVHNFLFKTDIVQSEKTNWSVRYVGQRLKQLHDATLPHQQFYPGNGAYRNVFNQNLNTTVSHSYSPQFINEIRGGYNRFNVAEKPQDYKFDPQSVGLPLSTMSTVLLNGIDLQSSGQTPFAGVGTGEDHSGIGPNWADSCCHAVFPTMDYLFPFARLGAPLSAPGNNVDTTFFAADNMSWTHGKHGFKAGAEYRHLQNEVNNSGFARGFIYSSNIGEFTSDSETCNGGCSGTAFTRPSFDFAQSQAPYNGDFKSFALAFFAQDTWRIHPHFTINFGVRYEYFSTPHEDKNRIWNYDPVANGLVQQGSHDVFDQYGNPCGTVPTTYASLPSALASGSTNSIFTSITNALPKGWNCGTSGSGAVAQNDYNNFAPRAGFAWDLRGDSKTVLRMGAGMFYDQSPANYTSQLMLNRPTSTPNAFYGQIFNPGASTGFCATASPGGDQCAVGSNILFDPTVQAASFDGTNPNIAYSQAQQPFSVYARDTRHSATPYTIQVNGSMQQSLGNNWGMEVGYVGGYGRNLPVVYNGNFSKEWDTTNLFVDNFAYSPIFTLANRGESSYHSFLLRLRAADFHGLRMNATYSYSRSVDNASNALFPWLPLTGPNTLLPHQFFQNGSLIPLCIYDAAGCPANVVAVTPTIDFSTGAVTTTGQGQVFTSRYLIPQDPFHFLQNDRGPSDFDVRNRFVVDYTYDVPSLSKAWHFPKWMDNWQVSGIYTFQTGQPFSIFAGPILGEITQRANVSGVVTQDNNNPGSAISLDHLSLAANSAACSQGFSAGGLRLLTAADTVCAGNSGRNAFTGPQYSNMNMALQKGFHLFGEGRMLTFRSEFYNLFNVPNYYNPISALSVNGSTINGDFGKIKSAHDPRQIQFAVRYNW